MEKLIFAEGNNRELNFVDKIFGIAAKATEMKERAGADKVINGTIGTLLDDNGKLIVFYSVEKALHDLSPAEFAGYSPIAGTPEFRSVIQKLAFGNYRPNVYTEAVATPGGAGTIRNAIVNYSREGDYILTSDWYWAAYKTLATENYRKLTTYELINEKQEYNIAAFEAAVKTLLEKQDSLLVIINTPAHNPTGFALTNADWAKVIEVTKKYAVGGKKITVFVDAAYIDFTDNPDEARSFLKLFELLPESVLGLYSYSASKGFTMYGMRCGALICMAKSEEVAKEFVNVMTFSGRGTWSNPTKAPQQMIVDMYNDKHVKEIVDKERDESRVMLMRRGKAFEEAAEKCGLRMIPYMSGFFASIPCEDSDAVGEILQKEGIFLVPLAKGLRVSLAAVNEAQCRIIAPAIKRALDAYEASKK